MHWALWLVLFLVSLAVIAWFAFELVPFVVYPLLVAGALLIAWRVSRRAKRTEV